MATVLTRDGLRFVIYPNDHRPAHIHVIGKDAEAVFYLACPEGPPRLRENYRFAGPQLRRILRMVEAALPQLCREWREYMGLSDDEIREADARMAKRLEASPHAVAARFDHARGEVVLGLSDASHLAFPPDRADALRAASPEQLAEVEISPSGLGLHWPSLDADLYLPSLLEGQFGAGERAPLDLDRNLKAQPKRRTA